MGYNRRSGTGYLSSPGGHASIEDDGNGKVKIASGKKLIVQGGTTVDCGIQLDGTPGTGVYMAASAMQLHQGSSFPGLGVNGSQFGSYSPRVFHASTATFTSAASTISGSLRGKVNVTANGVYTMTGALPAGVDGEVMAIENVGSNAFTFQDVANLGSSKFAGTGGLDLAIGSGALVWFMYSTDATAWKQISPIGGI